MRALSVWRVLGFVARQWLRLPGRFAATLVLMLSATSGELGETLGLLRVRLGKVAGGNQALEVEIAEVKQWLGEQDQEAGKREQGTIIGLTQSLMSIAQITAPIISGLLIEHQYLTTWAVWAGVLAGLALFFQPSQYRTDPAAL